MAGLHLSRCAALRPAGALVALLALAACEPGGAGADATARGDPVVARVTGQAVYASEVRREAVAEGSMAEGAKFDPGSELFARTLDEVVDEKLLAREARRLRIDHDPAVRRRLAASADKIVGDALVEAVVDKAITEQAIQSLYDEQRKLAPRPVVIAGQALQPLPSLAEARPQIVRFLTYDEIRTLLARLRATHKVEMLVPPPPPHVSEPASAPATLTTSPTAPARS